METIAIISDIHANVVALDTVLVELERLQPDRVVCLGDVAATGPAPREVIARLRGRGWSFVRGNCDDNLLRYASGNGSPINDKHDEIDHWCASRLSTDDLEFLASFHPSVAFSASSVEFCCYHGSPQSNLDEIVAETPIDNLNRWFQGQRAALFAGGHTHAQMLRRYKKGYVINPGSVGLPFTYTSDGREVNPLWAEFALVHIDGSIVAVELRRIPVDRAHLMAVAAESGMPCQSWWTRDWE